jgi:creatinine amidohydrolase
VQEIVFYIKLYLLFFVGIKDIICPTVNPASDMYLKNLTWQETETYLRQHKSIVLPIGSFEQHGPNGMIGTDIICPERVAQTVSESCGILIGPSIPVGMAQHHLAFAGSITVLPTTLIAIIRDYVASLARHGFTQFMFLNGHGGNIASVQAAFSQIHAEVSLGRSPQEQPELELVLCNWFAGKRVMALSNQLYPGIEGSHATPSEVSLTYFAYQEHTKTVGPMQPRVAPNGRFGSAQNYRENFPDGRIGSDPSGANAEHGARLNEASCEDVVERLNQLGFM